jgi:hypothetical protein
VVRRRETSERRITGFGLDLAGRGNNGHFAQI